MKKQYKGHKVKRTATRKASVSRHSPRKPSKASACKGGIYIDRVKTLL